VANRALAPSSKLAGVISAKPGLNRFLTTTAGGLLRIDRARVTAEQKLDGKFLLRFADAKISAEDIALGYTQLLEVERGWRDMKQITDLRPVYHRLEDRIRAAGSFKSIPDLLKEGLEQRTAGVPAGRAAVIRPASSVGVSSSKSAAAFAAFSRGHASRTRPMARRRPTDSEPGQHGQSHHLTGPVAGQARGATQWLLSPQVHQRGRSNCAATRSRCQAPRCSRR
jgi:hypothetical protein